jgi:hypothetical protein
MDNIRGNQSDDPHNSKEFPDNLKDAMQLDCLVNEVPGNGACLFTSTCLWIKATKERKAVEQFRKQCHRFIVEHFEISSARLLLNKWGLEALHSKWKFTPMTR